MWLSLCKLSYLNEIQGGFSRATLTSTHTFSISDIKYCVTRHAQAPKETNMSWNFEYTVAILYYLGSEEQRHLSDNTGV